MRGVRAVLARALWHGRRMTNDEIRMKNQGPIQRIWSIIFPITTCVATLIAVIVGVSWARSHRAPEAWVRVSDDHWYTQIVSRNGMFTWQSQRDCPWKPTGWTWMAKTAGGTIGIMSSTRPVPTEVVWEEACVAYLGGFRLEVYDFGGPSRYAHVLQVPHAALLGISALLPCLFILSRLKRSVERQRRDSRREKGRCPECGYDLCASPGNCPECGWAAGSSPAEYSTLECRATVPPPPGSPPSG
jgi:hypothetical protein